MEKPVAYKRAPISVAIAFGLPIAPEAKFMGFEPNADAPRVNPGYVFKRERLKDMAVFWESGFTALKLTGDPAAGKTSLVKEWHARLNAPLAIVSCSGGTQEHHLYGQLLPDLTNPGVLKWRDGKQRLLDAGRDGAQRARRGQRRSLDVHRGGIP